MKRWLYEFLRLYVWTGLRFYFRSIRVFNAESLPQHRPILFLANHQNAFLDALLIVTSSRLSIHFLARAGAFRSTFYKPLLNLINLIPIYRIRDGWDSLEKNADTFNQCFQILRAGESILMFPEGNHDFGRRLRPLSRGFTKIALDEQTPADLVIVPVGINYEDHESFFGEVSVYYGPAIETKAYARAPAGANLLRDDAADAMRDLIVHVDGSNEREIITQLRTHGIDVCDPAAVKKALSSGKFSSGDEHVQASRSTLRILSYLVWMLSLVTNALPLGVWMLVRKKIDDPVLMPSIRFAVGISVFPLFYLTVGIAMTVAFNLAIGMVTLLWCLVSLPLKEISRQRV